MPIPAIRLILCEHARGQGLAYYQKVPRQEFVGNDLWSVTRSEDGTIRAIHQPNHNLAADIQIRLGELHRQLGRCASDKRGCEGALKHLEGRPASEQVLHKEEIQNLIVRIAANEEKIEALDAEIDSFKGLEFTEEYHIFRGDLGL